MAGIDNIKKAIDSVEKGNIPRKTIREQLEGKQIIVFGAGWVGQWIKEQVENCGLEIYCFLDDAFEGEYLGKAVYFASTHKIPVDIKENAVVIVSFMLKTQEHRSKLFHKLRNLGFADVRTMNVFSSIKYDCMELIHNKQKILDTYALLKDQESRDVFVGWIENAAYMDDNRFALPTREMQYFPTDIPFKKGYSTFIDGGSYTGDTYLQLGQLKKAIYCYIAFEPDLHNFNKLCKSVAEKKIAKNHLLYPCGMLNENKAEHFQHVSGGGSSITEAGDEMVLCVALDEVLPNCNATMIKMDIEGAELKALEGSKNIIKCFAPDLEICVYHKLSDLWEIPLMIHELNGNYDLYMRSHCLYGMETVLYAVEK